MKESKKKKVCGGMRIAVLILSIFILPFEGRAQSMGHVPGVVISHLPAPNWYQELLGWTYVSDPCILVRSNGDYIASHAEFGRGSSADSSGKTYVFRSTNQGATWTQLNQGNVLNGILRASLFEQNGNLYLRGADKEGGNGVVYRSTNNGTSWTSVSFSDSTATPDNVIEYDGRHWMATTRSALFFEAGEDPFLEANWGRGNSPAASDDWLPGTGFTVSGNHIGEGQIAVSQEKGIAVLSKVRLLPYIAVGTVLPSSGRVFFDPDHDFIRMEGGEKKFGVRFDEVSGKYYMLSNPILPAHYGSSLAIDLIRNTAAVLTSRDLRNWRTEQIFLYSPNISYEGFQYFNFDVDGDDIVIASRTAFDVGGNKPPRGHDSNLLTFHRIPNFRQLEREHVLRLESGTVRRHEKTQHRDAPLGNFAIGSSFAGSPLTQPVSMGVSDGTVYIRESGGRILSFDLTGNFLGTVASAPVSLQTGELAIPQPPEGTCVWTASGSSIWDNQRNWYYWNRPGTPEDRAVFGSAASGNVTVTLPSAARKWTFQQNGNFEGWSTAGIQNAQVSGGLLRGTASDSTPQLDRLLQNFSGAEAPEVRVRMRAETAGEVPVEFWWATSRNDGFHSSRSVQAVYSGNGAFQEVVIPMTGASQWDNRDISRIRVRPLNGAEYIGTYFEVDSISVPLTSDGVQMRELVFHNQNRYTLSGSNPLRLASETGPAAIHVRQGSHVLNVPVRLEQNTGLTFEPGTKLAFNQPLTFGGNGLAVSGAGEMTVAGILEIDSGVLQIDEAASISVPALHFSGAAPSVLRAALRDTSGSGIQISGDLVIASDTVLEITVPDPQAVQPGSQFTVLEHGGARTGTFLNLNDGDALVSDGFVFTVHYLQNEVRVTAQQKAFFTVPYSENFEGVDEGAEPTLLGWESGAFDRSSVILTNYTYGGVLPLPEGPHTKVFEFKTGDESVTVNFSMAENEFSELYFDQMVYFMPMSEVPDGLADDPNAKTVWYMNEEGHPVLFHGGADGNTGTFTVLNGQFTPETWHRVTIAIDMDTAAPVPFFQILVDGMPQAGAAEGFSAPTLQSGNYTGGTWFRFANYSAQSASGTHRIIRNARMFGTGMIDDFVLTNQNPSPPVIMSIPYVQSFENLSVGAAPAEFGWQAGSGDRSSVILTHYTYDGELPLPESPHTRVLEFKTGETPLSVRFNMEPDQFPFIYLDQMANFSPMPKSPPPAIGSSDVKTAWYMNEEGHLVLFHGGLSGNTGTFTVLDGRFTPWTWRRVTVVVDMDTAAPIPFFQILVDGEAQAGASEGFSAPTLQHGNYTGGTWFRFANYNAQAAEGTHRKIRTTEIHGTGMIDDFVVTDTHPEPPPRKTYWVQTGAGSGGSAEPSGEVMVKTGDYLSVVYTADPFFSIGSLYSNNSPVSEASGAETFEWTALNISGNITNQAVFAAEIWSGDGRTPLWWVDARGYSDGSALSLYEGWLLHQENLDLPFRLIDIGVNEEQKAFVKWQSSGPAFGAVSVLSASDLQNGPWDELTGETVYDQGVSTWTSAEAFSDSAFFRVRIEPEE